MNVTIRTQSTATAGASGRTAQRQAAPDPMRAVMTFETFYQREFRSVIGLAYALSGSRSAAEDLAQDAFLAAHRSWDSVGRYDKPQAWVRRVVANMSVSMFRRSLREAKAIARMKSEEAILPSLPAEDEQFWKAVRALPKRQAQAIALHYLEDRSVAEIAEILDCAEGTVKVHLFKGRQKLAQRLGIETGRTS